ncbi:MAG TPA: L-histidine N(alpha)-methyltransferase [Clostridia bacterium]|nr:L-histidine N(alpha)-methyltransferase [Clostridia bacterium]
MNATNTTSARTIPTAVIAGDVRAGLTATPKSLPPKLFYDSRGSELFEQITELPEYYLTGCERQIFEDHAGEMIGAAGPPLSVIELGAGSAAKTVVLLRAVTRRQAAVDFYPVDVSATALADAGRRIKAAIPAARTHPHVGDYTAGLPFLRHISGRRLVLYIGSSIGNFEPLEAGALLGRLRQGLSAGDALLLGTDMRKSPELLIPAYDDSRGVTAAFNKNILSRINRELDADFDLDRFEHRVVWNSEHSRVEMHLQSARDQAVNIRALHMSVRFDEGERIHTENSYKFTPAMIDSIARNGGFQVEQTWADRRGWFSVHLLRA